MYGSTTHPPKANANWKNDTAADPAGPKQWYMTPVYESLPLSFALMTTSRIVLHVSSGLGKEKPADQSVRAARAIKSPTPVTKPAWETA